MQVNDNQYQYIPYTRTLWHILNSLDGKGQFVGEEIYGSERNHFSKTIKLLIMAIQKGVGPYEEDGGIRRHGILHIKRWLRKT